MIGLRQPNIERLLAAHNKIKHDRVPNFEISIDPGALTKIMNWPKHAEGRSDGLSAETQIEIANRTCQDAILCNLQYWACGKSDICSWEDFEKVPKDFSADYARIKALDYLKAVQNSNIGVGVMLAGPFFTSYWCTGPIPIQSFMYMLYDDIDIIKKLMDIQTERQIEIVQSLEGTGIHFVEIADDLADNTGFMVPPAFMEELWYPGIERLIKAVKDCLNVPIQFHCCGNLKNIIKYFLKLGVDTITPIQTNCNDIYDIKKQYGNQFTLAGNISIGGVLAFGTPEQVEQDTKEHIERLGKNAGYIVASSHSIVDAIPPENYFAMVEAAIKYGKY